MNDPNKTPAVDSVLVDWLDRVFPDRCPNVTDTDREIWMAVGARGVVRKLRKISEEQSTDVLTS